MSAPDDIDPGRRAHYAEFFGDVAPPEGYGVVTGNCQAESLRIVLHSDDLPLVRVPPVHELTPSDAERMHRLLGRARVLIAQPVRDDYHHLPLGTAQLAAALPRGARTVTYPVMRHTGLYPFQAVLHVPGVEGDPPIAPYHDIRTLARAAGIDLPAAVPPSVVRAIAADATAELERREGSLDVAVSDLFDGSSFAQLRTVNHPGNEIFLGLGARVLEALGRSGAPADPGRPLLNGIHAPREPWVVDAWSLDEPARPEWLIDGSAVSADDVAQAHLRWYEAHPAFAPAALERLAVTVRRWVDAA